MIALVFDTETTGLVENRTIRVDRQAEIIEYFGAVADLATGTVLSTVGHLIRPKHGIGDKVVKITGIDDAAVAASPPFAEVADAIAAQIEAAPVVIAHNLSFDRDMIEIEFERLGRTIRWPPVLCTVEQSMHYLGRRLTLAALHEHLTGERFAGAHRAAADVTALVRIASEMFKRGDL